MEKRRVAQQKYVQSSQVTHRCKFDWKVGDVVRVKCPRSTGLSKFSSGKKIVQVGDSAVRLDDGKWWNKDKISLTKTVAVENVKGVDGRERVERKRCVGYGFFRALLVPRAVEPTSGEPQNVRMLIGIRVMQAVGAGDLWKEDGSKELS
ncbi:hypothetical protein NDU88_002366 [Pleurodeles waltl]|uniref:Uncharacterized protein n=1 Tax=Pleurodeles waltl TaxID=8319 RepID=A0AAV7M1C6_PLEWA|nr:hypothetical protein NDU88_002366 [Pleurodeles waltl]